MYQLMRGLHHGHFTGELMDLVHKEIISHVFFETEVDTKCSIVKT